MEKLDIQDIITVSTRLKRLTDMKPKVFVGSFAFKADLDTLLNLIEEFKKQNESSTKKIN